MNEQDRPEPVYLDTLSRIRADWQPPAPYITPPRRVLTSADPEPEPGTLVLDSRGTRWRASDEGAFGTDWVPEDHDGDPESWTKIAGNYGPVTVLEET